MGNPPGQRLPVVRRLRNLIVVATALVLLLFSQLPPSEKFRLPVKGWQAYTLTAGQQHSQLKLEAENRLEGRYDPSADNLVRYFSQPEPPGVLGHSTEPIKPTHALLGSGPKHNYYVWFDATNGVLELGSTITQGTPRTLRLTPSLAKQVSNVFARRRSIFDTSRDQNLISPPGAL